MLARRGRTGTDTGSHWRTRPAQHGYDVEAAADLRHGTPNGRATGESEFRRTCCPPVKQKASDSMTSGDEPIDEARPKFGRPDPYCWLLVGPMLFVAVVMTIGGVALAGIPILLLAGAVVAFDAWVNRSEFEEPYRRPRSPRDDWPSLERPMRSPEPDHQRTAVREPQPRGPGRDAWQPAGQGYREQPPRPPSGMPPAGGPRGQAGTSAMPGRRR